MALDATYTPTVYVAQGGALLVVASGGQIKIESGGAILFDTGTIKFACDATGLKLSGLPTSNPGAGYLYTNSNVLTMGS